MRRTDFAILAGVLLLLAVLFGDILFLGNGLFFRDIFRYHFPIKRVVREAMLSGHFPFWNSYFSGGQPLAANPANELFYPLQWLVLLPSYAFGFQLHILIHFAIGATGMYLLLRSMGLSRAATTFGTLSFTFGGFFFALVNVLPFFFSFAWLPWVAYFARRFLADGDRGALLLGAIALAMQGLIGEPVTMLQTWLLLFAYASFIRRPLRALALAVSGVALSAVQLLPAADLLRDSVRASGFSYETVTQWSMPPVRLFEMIVPRLLGHTSENALLFWGAGSYPRTGAPFFLSIYCGIGVGLFVLAALWMRERGARVAAIGIVAATVIATGDHTPLFRLLYAAGVRSVRYPEKFIMSAVFLAIVLAACAVDRFIEGDARVRRAALWIAAVVTGALAVAIVVSRSGLYASLFDVPLHLELSRATFIRALVTSALALLLIAWGRTANRAWLLAACAFVLADLLLAGRDLVPRMPAAFFDPPRVVATLDRGDRIFHEADWYESPTKRRWFNQGADTAWVVRNGVFPFTNAVWGLSTVLNKDYDETTLRHTGELLETMLAWRARQRTDWSIPFLLMSGAGYRTGFRPYDPEMARVSSDLTRAQPVEFVRVAEKSPRFAFARELVAGDFLSLLQQRRIRSGVAHVAFPPFAPAPGTIGSVREGSNRVALDVEARGRSFLVAAVTDHKYWSASVDGLAVPIRRTNIAYMGVEVPAGRHVVELCYRNPLIRVGGLVSLGALLALLFYFFRGKSRRYSA